VPPPQQAQQELLELLQLLQLQVPTQVPTPGRAQMLQQVL
jgi:hypothetical protein